MPTYNWILFQDFGFFSYICVCNQVTARLLKLAFDQNCSCCTREGMVSMSVSVCFFDDKENQDPALRTLCCPRFRDVWIRLDIPSGHCVCPRKDNVTQREHRETEGINYGDERLVLLKLEHRPKAEACTATPSPWLLQGTFPESISGSFQPWTTQGLAFQRGITFVGM